MKEAMKHDPAQTCPQCDNHCPADDLQCGRGRKYFGVEEVGHEHGHGHGRGHGGCCGHGQLDGLAGLLHRCGRFARHAGMEEGELFQAFTGEEKAALQVLLEKLSADWQARLGGEALSRCGHGHHGHGGEKHRHKHEGRGE